MLFHSNKRNNCLEGKSLQISRVHAAYTRNPARALEFFTVCDFDCWLAGRSAASQLTERLLSYRFILIRQIEFWINLQISPKKYPAIQHITELCKRRQAVKRCGLECTSCINLYESFQHFPVLMLWSVGTTYMYISHLLLQKSFTNIHDIY